MAKQDDYARYTIRVPADLYQRLQEAAGEASINAEIIRRLELSFQLDQQLPLADKALDSLETGLAEQRELHKMARALIDQVKDLRLIIGHVAEHGLDPEVQAALQALVAKSDGKKSGE
jgi:hypothetical protein